MKATSLDNLKVLTDSIKAGERVVLLPPGIFSLIAIIVLLIVATVTLTGSFISIFASTADVSIKAGIQFSSMGVIFLFIIFPGLMIFQGNKKFTAWSYYYAIVLVLASSLFIAIKVLELFNASFSIEPVLICFLTSLTSLLLLRSSSFILLKEFFYLLKKC